MLVSNTVPILFIWLLIFLFHQGLSPTRVRICVFCPLSDAQCLEQNQARSRQGVKLAEWRIERMWLLLPLQPHVSSVFLCSCWLTPFQSTCSLSRHSTLSYIFSAFVLAAASTWGSPSPALLGPPLSRQSALSQHRTSYIACSSPFCLVFP